jgi:hypothetical protein
MADELKTSTCGVDHVGLSVRDLVSTRKFFCDCLGWRIVGERADYPAVFVSDGHDVVTLWQVESSSKAIPFDRRANVGCIIWPSPSSIKSASIPSTSECRIGLASSSSSVRNPRVPALRSISSCGSPAEYGSSLRSILASRRRARRDEPVQAAMGRE